MTEYYFLAMALVIFIILAILIIRLNMIVDDFQKFQTRAQSDLDDLREGLNCYARDAMGFKEHALSEIDTLTDAHHKLKEAHGHRPATIYLASPDNPTS